MTPAMIGINVAFAIQMYLNYAKKAEIQSRMKAEDKEVGATSLLSAAGITTLFNAMTQTTTTLCANG